MKDVNITYYNKRVNVTASVIGVLLGLSGIFNHGLFEILQGNITTNGFYIEAIGVKHRFWLYGTEGAFTLIHNYLVTGISSVLVGVTIILWSIKYLQIKHGAIIFLVLLILLTLVGGGIGHIILFLPTWAFATRVSKSLDWWKHILSFQLRKKFSALWIYFLIATLISWLIVMELGIFGYFPGQDNPEIILNIVFIFLFSTVILACLSFIYAISGDID
ncbi:hypothetical protein ACE1ET_09435 [Saccharicrinis sp. FJH62]|uniref:hypothetical protein n=1 Tax=Saccharicrinis sp. FJH62 TaxID=3344657 RepID=UPI0035D51003